MILFQTKLSWIKLIFVASFQRNRLLLLPWLINSVISLFFNAIAIVLSVVISVSSKSPDYASIIPFAVAAIIIFGRKMSFQNCFRLQFEVFCSSDFYLQASTYTHILPFILYTKIFDRLHRTANIPASFKIVTAPATQFIHAAEMHVRIMNLIRTFTLV